MHIHTHSRNDLEKKTVKNLRALAKTVNGLLKSKMILNISTAKKETIIKKLMVHSVHDDEGPKQKITYKPGNLRNQPVKKKKKGKVNKEIAQKPLKGLIEKGHLMVGKKPPTITVSLLKKDFNKKQKRTNRRVPRAVPAPKPGSY